MVAVDVTPSRRVATAATQAYVPVDLPAGWEFDKVFGPDPEMRDAGLDDSVKRRYASLLQVAEGRGQAIAIAQAGRSIDLPEGATVADRKILVGLLALAFALMVAVATLAGRRALYLFQVSNSRSSPE
jgi:Ca-activated chloride channel family protein